MVAISERSPARRSRSPSWCAPSIGAVSPSPAMLVAHPSLAANNLKELIALARSRPGQVNFAGSGSGSTPHLAAELFNTLATVKMVHVPYRGGALAINELLPGRVDVSFDSAPSSGSSSCRPGTSSTSRRHSR